MARRQNTKYFTAPEGQAYCCQCDSYKPVSEFGNSKAGYHGLHFYCKSCVQKDAKKYSAEKVFANKAINYGISAKEYIDMLERQNHVCAICGEPETKIHKGVLASFCVDHDHETGKIRGLLCSSCNTAIGHLRDDVELLRTAIDYLNSNDAKPKRKKHDIRQVNQSQSNNENLRRIAHGLPKQTIGSDSDVENLPLFVMN